MRRLLILCLLVGCANATMWSPHLQGYWPFEGTRFDASGNGRTAYGVNTVYGPGVFGQCDTFNGTTAYDTIRDADSLSFTTGGGNDKPFTITFWLRMDTMLQTYCVAKRDGVVAEWAVAAHSEGDLYVLLHSEGIVTPYMGAKTAGTIPKGTRVHCAVTYDGSKQTSGIHGYLNAVAQAMTPITSAGTYVGMSNTTAKVYLGTLYANAYYLTGTEDEVAIWSRALSERDIRRVMMGMSPIE